MPHPLAIKYGTDDPSLWDDDKRAKAREELQDALGEGTGKAKRLKADDRIELMRIWLAVIAASHSNGTKALAVSTVVEAPKGKRLRLRLPTFFSSDAWRYLRSIMSWADYVFVLVLIGITASVVLLGVHSVTEVLRVEEVKKEAEDLTAWFKNTADERKNAEFEPAACRRSDDATWKQCVKALVDDPKGPLHGKINAFNHDHAMLNRKCDQQAIDTIGTIIVEKGAYAPGASSLSYTAFDGTEPMSKDYILRVVVCGRGFHLIKVQNEIAW